MLLAYCGDHKGSDRIEAAVQEVLAQGIRTRDLGDRQEPGSSGNDAPGHSDGRKTSGGVCRGGKYPSLGNIQMLITRCAFQS